MDCQLQVKLDILQGRLPVHNDLAAELAALALQCKSPKSLFILNHKCLYMFCLLELVH